MRPALLVLGTMVLVAGSAGGQVIPGLAPQMLALPRPDSAIAKTWVSYLELKEGQPDRNAQVASPGAEWRARVLAAPANGER